MSRATLDLGAVRGRVDRDGRLVEAEPALAELNRRAGGVDGGVLVVPQIAQIARLCRRLGVLISRPVVAADADGDVDLWVRAQPEDEDVVLAIGGWTRRPARMRPLAVGDPEHDLVRVGADWLWETDEALHVTLVTADAQALGAEPAAVIGGALTSLFRFLADPDGALPILSALASQRSFQGQSAEVARTGERVRLSATPMIDGKGRFSGFRGSAAREAAPAPAPEEPTESETNAFSLRLDAALRGPLSRIVESAEEIASQSIGPLRRDYADYAGSIASAGRHLLALVEDIVDLQAIERPDFEVEQESLDLAEIARRAARLLANPAAERSVRIDAPSPDEAILAVGEYRRALQVLVNLIGNAVRFSPEGGMIWVRAEREGDRATVVVADQGKGIATEDQARVFDKFTRLEPGDASGSGLGLYIARRLARAMGGDLMLDSAPGQGARFTFSLPAA